MLELYCTMCTISNTMRNVLKNWNLCIVLCHSPVSCTAFFCSNWKQNFDKKFVAIILDSCLGCCHCVFQWISYFCVCVCHLILPWTISFYLFVFFAFFPFQISSFHAIIFCEFIVLKRLTLCCALSFRKSEFFFVSIFFS